MIALPRLLLAPLAIGLALGLPACQSETAATRDASVAANPDASIVGPDAAAPDASVPADAATPPDASSPSPCESAPCLHGGACSPADGGFLCACPAGTSGPTCGVLTDGKARFQVLSPTLIRVEYADDGQFEDRPSITAIERTLPVPQYTTAVDDGWREIDTGKVLLRYKLGSGPFSPKNLTATLEVGGALTTVTPFVALRPAPCDFGTSCEAETSRLSGTASKESGHMGYQGSGFVSFLATPGAARWHVQDVPAAGSYSLWIRYANSLAADGAVKPRTLSLFVNGQKIAVTLPTTLTWETWGTFKQPVSLEAGTNTVVLSVDPGDLGSVNVDWIAAVPTTQQGAPIPTPAPTLPSNLGGWNRGLDGATGAKDLYDGILSRDGWYLLDDSDTALYQADGFPTPRASRKDAYQDGYLFAYGHDYRAGLRDFYRVTGDAVFLPRWAFGIWHSRYYAYSDKDLRDGLVPDFKTHQVPLDVVMVDTDWKAPHGWNGWEWESKYFPDPDGFMAWAKSEKVRISLNTHPSIQLDDPNFPIANATAEGGLILLPGATANRYGWDWAKPSHVKSYMDLHLPFVDQGVDFFWFDWCCEGAPAKMDGLPGDAWINHQYAKLFTDRGMRGFNLARVGSGWTGYLDPGKPNSGWSEHRYTVHFTGDTWPTWELLAFNVEYSVKEGNAGLPFVSHDIGSHIAPYLPDDMYIRWVQLSVFQPILRLHSNHGFRLPWEYPNVTKQASDLLRLREALVPYVYTVAREASSGGAPMMRGLYFDWPEEAPAYAFPNEFMFGDQLLVAPIVSGGGTGSVKLWFPPGVWTHFYTGAKYTGPAEATVTADYDSMPVFARAGGIVPMQEFMNRVGEKPVDPLLLRVWPGADGAFDLYEDEGEGLGYQQGDFALTPLRWTESTRRLQVGPRQGTYPGVLAERGYDVTFHGVDKPGSLSVDGLALPEVAASGTGDGWWYEAPKKLRVRLAKRSTASALLLELHP